MIRNAKEPPLALDQLLLAGSTQAEQSSPGHTDNWRQIKNYETWQELQGKPSGLRGAESNGAKNTTAMEWTEAL